MLSLWAKTSGTWINVLTVIVGTGLGLLLRNRLPQTMQQIIVQALGLLTLVIGFSMAGSLFEVQVGAADGVILALLAMVAGGILGEWWQLEKRLNQLGDSLKARVKGEGRFTEGFVATSLLFCIGPMTIIGSINNGLMGDATLLTLKATMDGLASIAFAGGYGIGVGFSALTILVVQGGISLLASLFTGFIDDPTTDPTILLLTGIGGLMIFGIGFGLLEVVKIRIASFLPALLLAPLLIALASF